MTEETQKHWLDPPDWWVRWRPLRWIALFAVVGVFASAFMVTDAIIETVSEPHPETESYTTRTPSTIELSSDFRSYTAVSVVVARLN